MFVDEIFKIGFRDIDKNYKLTNKALLGFFEDAAGIHSNKIGYGLLDIEKTNLTWFLIYMRVKVYKRAIYGDNVKITTWANGRNKLYAFRNYEAKSESGDKIAIASSRWVPINTQTGLIEKLTDEIFNKYEEENKINFEDETVAKLREPKSYISSKEYTVTKAMIDMNNHVHNTYYLNFIYEILPDDMQEKEFNDLEILYKNQILYNDKIKILYSVEDEYNYVVIKSLDETKLHAIIKFK